MPKFGAHAFLWIGEWTTENGNTVIGDRPMRSQVYWQLKDSSSFVQEPSGLVYSNDQTKRPKADNKA